MDINEVRKKIFERDNNKCYKCESTKRLVLDHIKPKSKFHYHGIDNILTLCWSCNSIKFIWELPQDEFDKVKKYLNEVNQRFTIDESIEMSKVIEEYFNNPKEFKNKRKPRPRKIKYDWRDLALPDRDGKLRSYTIYRMKNLPQWTT